MRRLLGGLGVILVLFGMGLPFVLTYDRPRTSPFLFSGSTVYFPGTRDPCSRYGVTACTYDAGAHAYLVSARCDCWDTCPVEWIAVEYVRRRAWRGSWEASRWTTAKRASGTEADGHHAGFVDAARVPVDAYAIRIRYQCAGSEPWGGGTVIGDDRDWIEHARDFCRHLHPVRWLRRRLARG